MARIRKIGPLARIKTGAYTGDGSTSQAIIGLGFAPKYVICSQFANADANTDDWWGTDQITGARCRGHYGTGNIERAAANRLVSLDSAGFTVSDAGADGHPNKNAQAYKYLAFG